MREEDKLKRALEAELDDAYREYLTCALKGETQEQMETGAKYKKNMQKICGEQNRVRETKKSHTGLFRFARPLIGIATGAAALIVVVILGLKFVLVSETKSSNDKFAYEGSSSSAAVWIAEKEGTSDATQTTIQNFTPSAAQIVASADVYKAVFSSFLMDKISENANTIAPSSKYYWIPEDEKLDFLLKEDMPNATAGSANGAAADLRFELVIPDVRKRTFSAIVNVWIDEKAVRFREASKEMSDDKTTVVLECYKSTDLAEDLTGKGLWVEIEYGDMKKIAYYTIER